MVFSIIVVFISFLVGFAMKRGGLCTYAAVLQMVNDKKIVRMMVFLGVAAWATLIILPLHWIFPNIFTLSLTHGDLLMSVIAGAILGVGAVLNKGCFFGTFVALVSGNINYIATLFGLIIGVAMVHLYINTNIPNPLEMSSVYEPISHGYIWLSAMVLFALFMAFNFTLNNNNYMQRVTGLSLLTKQSTFAMITIGIGGAFLYATVSGWNYSDVLTNATAKVIDNKQKSVSFVALLSTLSLIIGGISAAVMAKEFVISKAKFLLILGCFSGGILMGASSMFIPGGNDGLLLKGIPSLAPHALVGYFSMILSMLVLVYVFRNKHIS